MDVAAFLDGLRDSDFYQGQLEHVEELPERPGRFAEPSTPLPPALTELLTARGIDRLYSHQVAVLELARAGRDVVVVTGTASGKTLCYNLPILETALAEPDARALYLFPTKALAQDQHNGLLELLAGNTAVRDRIASGVFDGDTPTSRRRRIQAEAQLVLSNPDMLHASILPYHPKWSRFFESLRYVVVDEIHTYRGILGANVACVLRRLERVCAHYGSRPLFLAASATIANPGELAARLIGREVSVVNDDGAPRGRKYFALWNPAPLDRPQPGERFDQLARRSPADDAVALMVEAMLDGAQALTFTRTRQAAELVHRYVKQELAARQSKLADQVRAYRGGYLPIERREIESQLSDGTLRGVAATNALELGVDIGSLDVAVLAGYPGTIASTWQQAGRSGRRHDESLAVLVAGNDPVDQYLVRHPEYFFSQSPEHAVVDPENPYVLANHLRAAAFELPLTEADCERFGPLAMPIAGLLCDTHELTEVDGQYYFSGGQNPASHVSLRHMSDNTFSIVLRPKSAISGGTGVSPVHRAASNNEVIANVDAISAPELIYPQAVYLHNGESYFVRELDLEGKVAYVERHEMDYYTQAVLDSSVGIKQSRTERPLTGGEANPGVAQTTRCLGPEGTRGEEGRIESIRSPLVAAQHRQRVVGATPSNASALVAHGEVDVTWQTVAFKKIKFGTRENIGQGPVDIPAQTLATTGVWLVPSDALRQQIRAAGCRTSEGLVGLRNLAVVALPMVVMCDSRDLGGVVDSKNLGRSALILYDRYPGGLGYCEKGFEYFEQVLAIAQRMVCECPCQDGCPSCVGLPNLRPAIHSDPDLSRGYPIPDKAATRQLLEFLCGQAASVAAAV
jgi:DEAD/DEAH box helicase domain-containing protein